MEETSIVTPQEARHTATSTWRFFSFLFLISFVPLMALGSLKFFCEHRFAPRNMGIEAALADRGTELLLIGSSHTRQSYDVKTIEDETGRSSFIIAYDGMDLVTIDEIVSYSLAVNRCPSHVVVEAYGAFLSKEPDLEDPRMFFDAPPELKREFMGNYISEHARPQAYLDVFDLIIARGSEALLTYPVNSLVLRRLSYRGGTYRKVSPGVSKAEFDQFHADPLPGTPNPLQVAALNRLIEVAEARNIHLIFVESPLPQPVGKDSRIQELKADLRRLLEARHMPYVDGDQIFPTDDSSLFNDSNHLSSKGRAVFDGRIVPILRNWISGAMDPTHLPVSAAEPTRDR